MRVEEVAQELGISKSHAYKVIHILVAFSEFPVPMPVYVCISFVTYEHPLYRFIVLHRGRFVYCPFLLVR